MPPRRIYITHCSAKKDDSLKGEGQEVTPDKLYTGMRTKAFMQRCMDLAVEWAILSDKYGIVKSYATILWYEKSPDKISEKEKRWLVMNFVLRLSNYTEIYFYHNPPRFHQLYREILVLARPQMPGTEIIMISKISEIIP